MRTYKFRNPLLLLSLRCPDESSVNSRDPDKGIGVVTFVVRVCHQIQHSNVGTTAEEHGNINNHSVLVVTKKFALSATRWGVLQEPLWCPTFEGLVSKLIPEGFSKAIQKLFEAGGEDLAIFVEDML